MQQTTNLYTGAQTNDSCNEQTPVGAGGQQQDIHTHTACPVHIFDTMDQTGMKVMDCAHRHWWNKYSEP